MSEKPGSFFSFAALAFTGYVALTILASAWLGAGPRPRAAGVALAVLAAAPVVAVLLRGRRVVLASLGVERELLLGATSAAFFVTVCLALVWGLLESFAAAPTPSAWWTYAVAMLAWLGCLFLLRRRVA